MEEFPFTEEEWRRVDRATTALTNATLANDEIWHASASRRFRRVIRDLRKEYGDHPVLMETWADFLGSPERKRRLYCRAIRISMQHRLPTLTIRISYARLLFDSFHDSPNAIVQLQRCEREVLEVGDEYDKSSWNELMEEIRAKSSRRE
jgi:N-methylhydantoinase B/oxoprolinase/acetone carboxylase alpha subunit